MKCNLLYYPYSHVLGWSLFSFIQYVLIFKNLADLQKSSEIKRNFSEKSRNAKKMITYINKIKLSAIDQLTHL